MCGSKVDIQSATAENRRRKKRQRRTRRKKEETTVEEYNWPVLLGDHKNSKMT